jgi:hypothetical protein
MKNILYTVMKEEKFFFSSFLKVCVCVCTTNETAGKNSVLCKFQANKTKRKRENLLSEKPILQPLIKFQGLLLCKVFLSFFFLHAGDYKTIYCRAVTVFFPRYLSQFFVLAFSFEVDGEN